MELNIERVVLLLLVACTVSMLGRKLRLPYTVGLVITGAGLAISPLSLDLALTREMIFTAFLPPLIFEAAYQIAWRKLSRDLLVVGVLATIGVLVSAGITSIGVHYITRLPWSASLLLGVLLAATDPVSVIAMFKQTGVETRLRLLVEAESLLNDATAAVLFSVALTAATGGPLSLWHMSQSIVVSITGGVACGALVGGGSLLLAGRTDDHLVEVTFTLIAGYGSFLLAEHAHLSGVLATLTAGILMGNVGSLGALSPKGREEVVSFWDYLTFVVNSLIFLMIGVRLAHHSFAVVLAPAIVTIVFLLIGRAAAVYGCCALFARSRLRVALARQHVLVWGGLRGALALALALGLPDALPLRATLLTIVFAAVGFSVVVQGLTITPFMRRLGELQPTLASDTAKD